MTGMLTEADLAALPERARSAIMALSAQVETLETERAEHADMQARIDTLETVNARLEYIVAEFRKLLFGKRSERLAPDQRELALEDLEIARSETETASEAVRPEAPRPARKRNLGHLPAHLERIEDIVEPDITDCPHCGEMGGCGAMVCIGENRSERLDVVPARFRVIVTVRPKYACRTCERGVAQAPMPARLIEGALPTEALLAHVLMAKFCDHQPLYRQAQGFARSGIEIDRSTLADWVGKAAFHLRPVAERLSEHLKASSHLFMDETTLPVLDPGRGSEAESKRSGGSFARRTKTGYLWTLARDERGFGGSDPPGVVYAYAPGRGGKHAEDMLEGFTGTLLVDGYSGYNRLATGDRKGGVLKLAHCWAHARRKLKEVHDHDASPIAKEGLERIAKLYAIEKEVRGTSPETRLAVRQEKTAPLVAGFFDWLHTQRARVSRRSRLGEKLAYIDKLRHGLMVFTGDGRVEIDNNPVENRIRPIALGRKNALFAGHDEGARSWATIASLIETAKLNGVEPSGWLQNTLEAIAAGHPRSRIDDLLPWNHTCVG
jgi:transposase